jgi:hypothetical protein
VQLILPNFLLASGDIASRVGNRVFWDELPQGMGYPAIILLLISQPGSYHHQGVSALTRARVQFDCRAATADDARQLLAALDACLSGYKGTYDGVRFEGAFKEGHRTSFDMVGETRWFQASTDYLIWWQPA